MYTAHFNAQEADRLLDRNMNFIIIIERRIPLVTKIAANRVT